MNSKSILATACLLLLCLTATQATAGPLKTSVRKESANKEIKKEANVVEVTPGLVQPIYVSSHMLNEIITPFSDPVLIHEDQTSAVVTQDKNIVYVSMGQEKFFQILIRSKDQSGPSINLMLMPQDDILGNSVRLKIPGQTGQISNIEKTYNAMPYVDSLKEMLRDAARNKVGNGFTHFKSFDGAEPFQIGNIMVRPLEVWKGSQLQIEKWSVSNLSEKTVKLTEPNFYTQNVRAIALFPNKLLARNDSTFLYRINTLTTAAGE